MKKLVFLAVSFILAFQFSCFAADFNVSVDKKTVSSVTMSVSGESGSSAVGVWADFDADNKMVICKTAPLSFTDGKATLQYDGTYTTLRFMVFENLENIKPLCKATDITYDDIIFDQGDGIEDLGDIE